MARRALWPDLSPARELEWEKAARGVDGRFFPWGDFVDPTFACLRTARRGAPLPAPVDTFPIDESPYGMRGAAGNASDWTADARLGRDAPGEDGSVATIAPGKTSSPRVTRGGAWSFDARVARTTHRRASSPGTRSEVIGFRVARRL